MINFKNIRGKTASELQSLAKEINSQELQDLADFKARIEGEWKDSNLISILCSLHPDITINQESMLSYEDLTRKLTSKNKNLSLRTACPLLKLTPENYGKGLTKPWIWSIHERRKGLITVVDTDPPILYAVTKEQYKYFLTKDLIAYSRK